MFDSKRIDELARRLSELMPAGARAFQQDIERNLRAGLRGAFEKMDLVTREEYEVQVQLLARSRERLQALEARVLELEARLDATKPEQG